MGRPLVRTVFDQPTTEEVKAQFSRVLDTSGDKFPDAAEHLDDTRDDVLAFTAFPRELWRKIWSKQPAGTLKQDPPAHRRRRAPP